MNIINVDKVKELLDSDISAYEIEKYTSLNRTTIGEYRRGKADLKNMSLDKAFELQKFWENRQTSVYKELKKIIEDDLLSKNLGSELEDFDLEKLPYGPIKISVVDSNTKVYLSAEEIDLEDVIEEYAVDIILGEYDGVNIYYSKKAELKLLLSLGDYDLFQDVDNEKEITVEYHENTPFDSFQRYLSDKELSRLKDYATEYDNTDDGIERMNAQNYIEELLRM